MPALCNFDWLRSWLNVELAHSFETASPECEHHTYKEKSEWSANPENAVNAIVKLNWGPNWMLYTYK